MNCPEQVILCIENIPLVGKNEKYTKSRSTGRLILTPQMRQFKDFLSISCNKKVSITPPQRVHIEIKSYHDIDALIESILDAIKKAFKNKDDRDIIEIVVKKIKIPRGTPGSIKAWAETVNDDGRECNGLN